MKGGVAVQRLRLAGKGGGGDGEGLHSVFGKYWNGEMLEWDPGVLYVFQSTQFRK